MLVKGLKDVKFDNKIITFEATVLNLVAEGDGEKRPFKFTVRFEESGDNYTVSSWRWEKLDIVKKAVDTDDILLFTAQPGVYGNYGEQIRVGDVVETGRHSTEKIVRHTDIEETRKETLQLINRYTSRSPLNVYLKELIVDDPNYWIYPAATKIHHNFKGGVAVHSLAVCKQAIAIAEAYKCKDIAMDVLVAGALLHDIGKVGPIGEYKEDGTRTKYGNLIPHPVIGYEKIVKVAMKNGIDPERDTLTIILSHIILSHHGKLEFGAPCLPATLEAMIVSRADSLDAGIEASERAFDMLPTGEFSEKLVAADGAKIFKWRMQ